MLLKIYLSKVPKIVLYNKFKNFKEMIWPVRFVQLNYKLFLLQKCISSRLLKRQYYNDL